jgi:hypothetical protein
MSDQMEAAEWRNPACGSPYDPFETDKCCEYTVDTVDTVDGLDPGTYYLTATAYDEDGNESAQIGGTEVHF